MRESLRYLIVCVPILPRFSSCGLRDRDEVMTDRHIESRSRKRRDLEKRQLPTFMTLDKKFDKDPTLFYCIHDYVKYLAFRDSRWVVPLWTQ